MGDRRVVLRVLYLIYTTGHTGPPTRVDLAGEAIRLARRLTLATQEPEARGLLALLLLNHARPRGPARRRWPRTASQRWRSPSTDHLVRRAARARAAELYPFVPD